MHDQCRIKGTRQLAAGKRVTFDFDILQKSRHGTEDTGFSEHSQSGRENAPII